MLSTKARWVAVSATIGSLLAGCADGETIIYITLPDAGAAVDAGDGDDGGNGGGGGSTGDEDAGPSCNGQCVPLTPDGFIQPMLLWIGPEGEPAPPCPEAAPVKQYTGHTELVIPDATCPACNCRPSTGSCGLPSAFTAYTTAGCGLPATETPFDAPASWDGSCSAANPVAAGAQCPPGSGIPCVHSLSSEPMSVIDEGCKAEPEGSGTSLPLPSWGQVGMACEGNPGCSTCGDPGRTCVASAPGFRQCVHKEGDVVCPTEGYTDRIVLYGGFQDERVCSECSCGPVEGSHCTAWAGIYKDAACAQPLQLGIIASTGPSCHDFQPPGEALGSKSVMDVMYHPGTCGPSGGDLTGTVLPSSPTTFCCLSEKP